MQLADIEGKNNADVASGGESGSNIRQEFQSVRGYASVALLASSLALWALTWHLEALVPGILFAGVFWFAPLLNRKWLGRLRTPLPRHLCIDPWLLFVVCIGGVVIALFGFQSTLLAPKILTEDSFENWHRGAIVWACVIGLFSLFELLPIIQPTQFKWILGLMIISLIVVTVGVFQQWLAILLALWITFCSAVVNGLVWLGAKRLERGSQDQRGRGWRAQISFLLVDTPTLIGFLVLAAYYAFSTVQDDEGLTTFVSGAISFQLLTSKTMFILIEAGTFDARGNRPARLT